MALRRSTVALALLAAALAGPGCTPAQFAKRSGSYALVQVRPGAKVDLHAKPGGRVVARIASHTEFGSNQAFWVAERRGRWLGVTSSAAHGNRLGWIAYNPLELRLLFTQWSVRASLSRRELVVSYGNRVLRRFPVTIGASGTDTPAGRFSVTDALAGRGVGPWYGCCVLALSGHQASLPSDWIGGDRIAIHGTPGPVGGAASHGCLRASNLDMTYLFAKLPIGAPVTITR
ncbi:MAG: hypothetical protein QOJ38_1963 [Solirubrobacterales bacterium]|nr:hypothetical protein [Solirubrobacterales bacterium]